LEAEDIISRRGETAGILIVGLNLLIPVLDKVKYVQSLKEIAIDIPQQAAISSGQSDLFSIWEQRSALRQEAHTTFFFTQTHLMDICSRLFPFLKAKDMVLLVFLPWRGKSVALYSRYIPISFFHLVYFNGSSPHAPVLFSLFFLFLFSSCFFLICLFTIIHVSSCDRSC
jgi:hypothetical protein